MSALQWLFTRKQPIRLHGPLLGAEFYQIVTPMKDLPLSCPAPLLKGPVRIRVRVVEHMVDETGRTVTYRVVAVSGAVPI